MSKFVFQQKNILSNKQDQNINTLAINEVSGINGIISDKSTINIYNSEISSNNNIVALTNNKIFIDQKSSISANTQPIISNKNNLIYNKSLKFDQNKRQVYSNSLYNFPTPFYETNNENNTTLLSSYPYVSKTIINDGSKIYFSSFKDAILTDNLSCEIYGSNITKINNLPYSCSLNYLISNLPKNLNGHNIQLIISNCNSNLYFQNIIGGYLKLKFKSINNIILTFNNCKNIIIEGNNIATIKSCIFNKCKNIQMNNIKITNILDTKQNIKVYNINETRMFSSIQFEQSHAFLKNIKFNLSQLNENAVGFTAVNSKIYLENCTFINYYKNCEFYGNTTVDTGDKANTLEEYNNQSISGAYTGNFNLDGLYKHLHTKYIPSNNSLPMGSIIAYPRILNGNTYLDAYTSHSDYPSGMLFTAAMINTLPSCLLPLDCNENYKTTWKLEYNDKLNILLNSQMYQYYPVINQNIYITDTTSANYNTYFLFAGNGYNATNFQIKTPNRNNFSKILSGEYDIVTNLKISCMPDTTYKISKTKTGIICDTYGTISSVLSATINFKDLYNKLVGNYRNQTILQNYFQKTVMKKSFISFKIDDYTVVLTLDQLGNSAIYDNNGNSKIPSVFFANQPKNDNTYIQSNVSVKFSKCLSQFKVYYYGIPSQNFNTLLGQDISSQYITVDGTEETTIYSGNNKSINNKIHLKFALPNTAGHYAWHSDTVLCLYLNTINSDVDINIEQPEQQHTIQYTQMVFRQVNAAYEGASSYLIVSANTINQNNKNLIGIYTIDTNNSNKWIHSYTEYGINIDSSLYPYILKESNTFKLYTKTNGVLSATFNNEQPSSINNNFILYNSYASTDLLELNNKFPKLVLDIQKEYQLIPKKYNEDYQLINKTYGFVPASAYNFNFSRTSINSNVSGYYRILDYNKQYIYEENSRILTGRINGFEHQLNILYNALNNMNLNFNDPYFNYYTNSERIYKIYPFEVNSVLSTTPYNLCSSIVMTNAFIYTLNRLTDILTYKHGTLITDNNNITKDIELSSMYKHTNIRNSNYINTYGMLYPLYNGNNQYTIANITNSNIPYIKQTDLYINDTTLSTTTFKYGNTDIPAYPIGAIDNSYSDTTFYLDILHKNSITLSGELVNNKLPLLFNLNNLTYNSNSAFVYDAYIQLPYNYSNLSAYVNSSRVGTNNNTKIEDLISVISDNLNTSGKNQLLLKYKVNGNIQESLFIIQGRPTFNKITYKRLVLPKIRKYYCYSQSFKPTSLALFNNFINNYNSPITGMFTKAENIWSKILSKCDNEASFISYSTLINNDPFIFSMQNSTATTTNIDMSDIKLSPINLSSLFSIGGTIQYFNNKNTNKETNTIFKTNYNLTNII